MRLAIAFVFFTTKALYSQNIETKAPIDVTEQGETLTIAELVHIALKNRPETKEAFWNIEKAASQAEIAKSAYYPQADLNGLIQHGRTFKFVKGPETTYTLGKADLILSLLVMDFGERTARVDAALNALQAAQWQENHMVQKVMIDVLEQAYATIKAQEILKETEKALENAATMQRAAADRHQAGLSPVSDVYQASSELTQIKIDLTDRKTFLAIQKGKLANSLGQPANSSYSVSLPPTDLKTAKLPLEALMALAESSRQDLLAMWSKVSEDKERLKAAAAAYSPKLSIKGRGGVETEWRNRAKGGHYEIGLSLDVPIFTGFKDTYETRLAFAELQASKEAFYRLGLEIGLEVLTWHRLVESAEETLLLTEENVAYAEKAYDGALERYKSGKNGFSDVSIVFNNLTTARIRHSEVKARYLSAIANLAYATGSLMPYREDTCAD